VALELMDLPATVPAGTPPCVAHIKNQDAIPEPCIHRSHDTFASRGSRWVSRSANLNGLAMESVWNVSTRTQGADPSSHDSYGSRS
jgi:hypothetical protein